MEKQITLKEEKVTYILQKSRRGRRMRLAVRNDGSIVVTTPFSFNREAAAEQFIREKSSWLLSKLAYFEQHKKKAVLQFKGKNYNTHKTIAYDAVIKRVQYFNNIYNFQYKRVSIRNQKTRWGSCSKQGNLNFNYKIAFLPTQLSDYIIVHEICHLKELNHSKDFWTLVERVFPNHKEIRKELRQYNLAVN